MSAAASEVAYLARALKMPRIPKAAELFAERARAEDWDYEAFLAAVLSEETNQREVRGSDARIKGARFPQIKTLDDFDFSFQRWVKRTTIAHLSQLDFLAEARTSCSSDLPAPARRISRLRWASRPVGAPSGLRSRPRTKWVNRLGAAKRVGLHSLRSRGRGAVLRVYRG